MMQFQSWLDAIRKRSRRRRQSQQRSQAAVQRPTESLEDRLLLSVSSLVINGELSIISDADDSIAVRVNPIDQSTLQVIENGINASTVGNVQVTDVTSIRIDAGAGANLIDLSAVNSNSFINLSSVSVSGNDGDDTIIGTLDLDDTIVGGDGHDSITGGLGANFIDAGDGHDEVTSSAGADTVDLGDGNDLLQAGDGDDSIRGGDGNDTITGDAGNDTIAGGNGADVLNGNDGDDSLTAGFGDDFAGGDDGDDTVSGGAGNDTVGGGVGDDSLQGNSQQDVISGDEGNDTIHGGGGRDTIDAGDGDDTVNGAGGRDMLTLGAGDDRGLGGGANDVIDGGDGNDTLIGNSGADTLRGGDGNDMIDGGLGSDRLEADTTLSASPTGAAAARLFAIPVDGLNQIAELDPQTGDELFRFTAPELASTSRDGLAFDGTNVFYLNGDGTDMLYEIDPNTQQLVDADPILAGSRDYDGLAFLGGLIYILDSGTSDIHVFDPVTDQIINTLDINGTNPTISPLIGGLAGAAAPDRLIVTEAGGRRVLEISPVTGVVEAAFQVGTASIGQYFGAAVISNEIYLGSGSFQSFDVFSRQGIFLRNVTLPYNVSAFGGDDLGAAQFVPGGQPQAAFDIDLRFTGTFTQAQQDIFTAAAARWEEIILGDVPDVFVPGIGDVDDIVIEVRSSAIDGSGGVLGQAALVAARLGSFLPSAAFVEFDSADLGTLESTGQLRDVMLHEMAHALGFGAIWEDLGLVSGVGGANPRFLGQAATAEYNLRFGLNEADIPVENVGGPGTADVHWRESVFTNDLLTSVLDPGSNPISRMTIASFQDLGYQVDLTAADALSVTGSTSLVSLFQAREQGAFGPLGQFASLGSGGGGLSDLGSIYNGVNPVDAALQQAADNGTALPVFGRTRLLDNEPLMVIPGLDPDKAAVISPEELEALTAFLTGAKAQQQSSTPLALVAPEIEPNNSIGTPFNVDALFSLDFDPNIGDQFINTSTAIPHASITATGDGTFDFYSFTVTNAGDRGIFDIDFGNEIGDSFDSEIFLFDAVGNIITDPFTGAIIDNDDASVTAGAAGSTSGLDSYMEFTFPAPGTYVLGVGQFNSTAVTGGITGNPVPIGSDYVLQISLENHLLTNDPTTNVPTRVFGDTLVGGAGNGNGRGDEIFGSPGNDLISGSNEADTIQSGDGDDSIFAGAGNDRIDGGAGDDTIHGNAGADTLIGGAGRNFLFWESDDGNDSVAASEGLDTFNVEGTNANDNFIIAGDDSDLLVVLDLPSGNDPTIRIASSTTIVSINGRDGNDQFDFQPIENASQVAVFLNGDDGRDTFNSSAVDLSNIRASFDGGDGDDTIMGGTSAEFFNGGAGDDLITGGDGADRIDGGSGSDTINGQSGNDTLLGSSGNDSIVGGLGDDSIDGGINNDTIDGSAGNDSLDGGAGNDRVMGRGGNDTLLGSAGNDTLEGNNGNDFLNGGSDNDLVKGGGGLDTLRGGDGDDDLRGGGRADVINAGDGRDLVQGGDDDDTITGGDGDDTVHGQAGDDTVVGGDGHDVLTGGGSSDLIVGGDGDDTLTGNSGVDTLAGGEGTDQIGQPDGQDVINETFALSNDLIAILQALPPVS